MTKSFFGDFIFVAFVLIITQLVSNYAFEEEPLALTQLFGWKKCISLLIGTVAGATAMYLFKRSKFAKSIDKK